MGKLVQRRIGTALNGSVTHLGLPIAALFAGLVGALTLGGGWAAQEEALGGTVGGDVDGACRGLWLLLLRGVDDRVDDLSDIIAGGP